MQHARQPVNDFTLLFLFFFLFLSLVFLLSSSSSLSLPSFYFFFDVAGRRNEAEGDENKIEDDFSLLSHTSPLAGCFCKRRGSPPAVVAAAAASSSFWSSSSSSFSTYLPSRPRRAGLTKKLVCYVREARQTLGEECNNNNNNNYPPSFL